MRRKRYLELPTLPNSNFQKLEITSPSDSNYNCIAWAVRLTDQPYWPNLEKPYVWPKDLPSVQSAETFIAFFQKHGFEICPHDRPEKGFEKIAIFEKNGLPTHACRLLKKDLWTSKIGILEDVRHSLHAISGGMYGEVSFFMKRPKQE